MCREPAPAGLALPLLRVREVRNTFAKKVWDFPREKRLQEACTA